MKFKKDDIVVCTSNYYVITKKDDIWRLDRDGTNTECWGKSVSSSNISGVRHATELEIIAFNQGITNLRFIKNIVQSNYYFY